MVGRDSIDSSVMRILDANLNRACEGLRVVEDYCRFVLESTVLARDIKNIRHDLVESFKEHTNSLLSSRDIGNDVGTIVTTSAEKERSDYHQCLSPAFKRSQQALRTLEEYAKTFSQDTGAAVEKLRYCCYGIEKVVMQRVSPLESLSATSLYVLITKDLCRYSVVETMEQVMRGGADIVQLREKDMTDLEYIGLAQKCRETADKYGGLLIVNDRVHCCQAVGADGVHLGQDDMPVGMARRILGDEKIIGKSTHCLAQAEQAEREGVDYLGVGPIYETNTKKHREAVGTVYIDDVNSNISLPYFAIGSVNRKTLDEVLGASPHAIAVCTAIIQAEDVEAETRFFKKVVSGHSAAQ